MNNTSILARSTSAMCLFRQWTSCKQTRRMLIYTLNGENTCSVEAVVSSIVTFSSWCRPLTGALNKLLAAQTKVSNAANAECLPKCNKAFVSQKAVLQQITKLPLLVRLLLAHRLLTSLKSSKVDNIICLVQTDRHAHATGQQHETGALKLNTKTLIPSRSTALQQLHPYRRQFRALRRSQKVSRQNVKKKQPKTYTRSQLGQLHCHMQCV